VKNYPAADSRFDFVSEKRTACRVDVRDGDGLSGVIRFGNGIATTLRIYDISLSGVSAMVDIEHADVIQEGQHYPVVIRRSWDSPLTVNAKCVWSIADTNRRRRYGFNFIPDNSGDMAAEVDNLRQRQIAIPDSTPIQAYLYKELFYRERLQVKVVTIGRGSITFSMDDTECLMIPGMKIVLNVGRLNQPAGQLQCELVESRVTAAGAEVVCSILEFPDVLQTWLVAYLLTDVDTTPAQLRSAGLQVRNTANLFRFRFAAGARQYHDVLQLRLDAYRHAGKVATDTDVEAMRAPLDSVSRILTVYHGTRLIASCAMAFPASEDTVLDTERALPDGYPADLPSKLDIIEISRLCVDPDYRYGDILVRMFEQMYRVCLASDRTYMISSADRKLWPLYKSIGFQKTAHRYDHPVFTGIEHTIISIHLDTPLLSKGLPHARWLHLYRDVNAFMQSRIGSRYSAWQSLKLRTATLLSGASVAPKNGEY
jgi:predicted GNAT family N-acyltransferase